MPSRACLLLSVAICASCTLAQQPGTPSPGSPEPQASSPAPDKDGFYHAGPGIDAPYLTSPALATYPADAAATDRPRFVRFTAVVAADGSLAKISVIDPWNDAYESAATAAVQQSKFAPGMLNGSPVPVLVCIGVPFVHLRPAVPHLRDCPDPNALHVPESHIPPGVSVPRATYMPNPEYSDQARKKKINGVVVLSTLVNEQGLPTDIRVEKGVGYGLDENAVQCVSQYRFEPARDRDGHPVAVRISIEISFRVN